MTCKQNQSSFLTRICSRATQGRPASEKSSEKMQWERKSVFINTHAGQSIRLNVSVRPSVTFLVEIQVGNS